MEITSRWYIYSIIKKEKTIGSADYQLSVEMYFVAIGLLERAERISQCRVSRLTTIAM